ncbi:hypothetical protein L6452_12379 [Arctium lappa]|uniref:Uncharacterized protein n=1 Tax=Arctium lappa TaxID=4217 RepID=A0ACB9DQH5_ARCLA|nr:hypothetical protein L6452_12379 [Arctium lappa]
MRWSIRPRLGSTEVGIRPRLGFNRGWDSTEVGFDRGWDSTEVGFDRGSNRKKQSLIRKKSEVILAVGLVGAEGATLGS